MEEILKLIREALDDSSDVEGHDPIEGETGVIGVSMADGTMFFVKVEPA
jgi:hypothetical protein